MKYSISSERLKEALKNNGMTQQQLADMSGVNKASISQYVNGSHQPSNISATKLANVLSVNPLWLMGFDEVKKKVPVENKIEYAEKLFHIEIVSLEIAQNNMRELIFTNQTTYDDTPEFWEQVRKYFESRFINHLWEINFDETQISQDHYFDNWLLYTVGRVCRPLLFLGNLDVCNAVRKHYGLEETTYDNTMVDYMNDHKYDIEELLERAKLLNTDGLQKLISYASDLAQIYNYRKDE